MWELLLFVPLLLVGLIVVGLEALGALQLMARLWRSSWVEICRVDDVIVQVKQGLDSHSEPELRLVSEARGTSLLEARLRMGEASAPELASGDPDFDRKLLVTAEPLRVAAALAPKTRRCLLELFDEFPEQGPGTPIHRLPRGPLLNRCPELADLARALSPRRSPDELRNTLLCNAQHDPLATVRARNLELLLAHSAPDSAVTRYLLEALSAGDPRVRLLAAAHCPPSEKARARRVLLELASGQHPAALRARALEAYARGAEETPDFCRLLTDLLKDRDSLVRTAAFAQLAMRGWQPEQGTLALSQAGGGELSLGEDSSLTENGAGTSELTEPSAHSGTPRSSRR